MKKLSGLTLLTFAIISSLFIFMAPLVSAQDEQSVESIIEQIQEHNEREEDIREELKTLSLNELESVDEYLSSKPDITMDENQILTLTQELLSNGNSVNYVVQENLDTAKKKEELRSEVQESVENLSEEEREVLRNELESNMDKSIEEEVVYDELLNIADKESTTTYLLLGIGTVFLGTILYAVNRNSISTAYSFSGIMLFALGLGLIAISLFDLYTS